MNRARRSFGVSMLVLLLGFIAIGGAIVYRAMRDDAGPASRYQLEAVSLPAGADVISSVAADGLVTVTYRIGGATEVRIINGETGETVGAFAIANE